MRIRLTIMLVLCLVVAGSHAANPSLEVPKGFIVLTQRDAPHFTLMDIDGVRFNYNNSSNKWRFVHFWASWCGPCRKEIPALEKLAKSDLATQMDMYIINTGEDEDTIFRFLGEYAPGLHTLMDVDGEVTEKYAPRGLPTTFLVNPQGKMVYLALGGVRWMDAPYYNFLKALVKTR